MRKALVVLFAAAALTGCSGGGGGSSSSTATAPPALKNPIDFPLYSNANVISSKAFTQVVQADTASGNSVFAQGNGKYSGHEVIASSAASFSDLSGWVDQLNSSPPSGYVALEPQSNQYQQTQSERYGLNYALFKKKNGSATRGLLVIVMDPQRVNARLGTILGMVDKYRALPAVLRGPIDDEAKARYGMTITQATQPDSPIGAALAALGELEHKDTRGIVVLDAQKQ